jgi:hypothetical protein
MAEPKVLRSFFVDQRVDQVISRLALARAISKNELFRQLLRAGMQPFVDDPSVVHALKVPPGSELDEREGDDKVLRSIYLEREFDEFLRRTAFELRSSKSELMRQFIASALAQASSRSPRPSTPDARRGRFDPRRGETAASLFGDIVAAAAAGAAPVVEAAATGRGRATKAAHAVRESARKYAKR